MNVAEVAGAFDESRARFESLVGLLGGEGAAGLSHGELEESLQSDGRELLRQLFQDHLSLRAEREKPEAALVGADGLTRRTVEAGRTRVLASVFGDVTVTRRAYRARGVADIHLADAHLNLPVERHSHGLRRLAAIESCRGSYDDALVAIERATGRRLGKRQVEDLVARAAVDFDGFYDQHPCAEAKSGDALVLSCDAKGVVMRPGALRPKTAKAAARATSKLTTRLSSGEKRYRKRMAEVGCVYDITPVVRTACHVMPGNDSDLPNGAPSATNKWLTASVIDDATLVVARVFDEACRRDPGATRTWVALVDGNSHQIDRIRAEARARGAPITIILDFIHVLEYLWKAAWCFHEEGDPAVERWVRIHALKILDGHATTVAGNIRRQATKAGLDPAKRKGVDVAARYLTNKHELMDYPTALAAGWPIATGVIEGACRHLVKDRMDLTGARWGLPGAEAILKLRAITCNNDFDAYWRYHIDQEHRRVHRSRYPNDEIPHAA